MESSCSPTKQYNESCPFLALTEQAPIGPKRIAKMSHVMKCPMSYVPCCDSPLITFINMSYHVISHHTQRFSMAENISLRTTESSFFCISLKIDEKAHLLFASNLSPSQPQSFAFHASGCWKKLTLDRKTGTVFVPNS